MKEWLPVREIQGGLVVTFKQDQITGLRMACTRLGYEKNRTAHSSVDLKVRSDHFFWGILLVVLLYL